MMMYIDSQQRRSLNERKLRQQKGKQQRNNTQETCPCGTAEDREPSIFACASWREDSCGFIVWNKHVLVQHFLIPFLGCRSYNSFRRKLLRWGFLQEDEPSATPCTPSPTCGCCSHVTEQSHEPKLFWHPYFRRSDFASLSLMRPSWSKGFVIENDPLRSSLLSAAKKHLASRTRPMKTAAEQAKNPRKADASPKPHESDTGRSTQR